jgi:lipopolysaccharide transport system ATP-binding protein
MSTSDAQTTFWALQDVDLEVKRGEVLGVVGQNGAGKSTLLKILSRITPPTRGRVHYRGRVAALLEVGTGFHRELTGRENIYLNGAILGMRRQEITQKMDEIVAFSGVEKFLDMPVKYYSSGMYVRLAFSVAAHLESDILLIDEVLAVGDIAFQKKCLQEMESVAQGGRTILFVSHNTAAIRSLCKRVVFLDQGRIAGDGDPHAVIETYEKAALRTIGMESAEGIRDVSQLHGHLFFVKRVEMLDLGNRVAREFRFQDRFKLRVYFEGELSGESFSAEFAIFDEWGRRIATGASGCYHGIFFSKSVKRVEMEIGPLVFTTGNYRVDLSVMSGEDRLDTWENACSFSVVECRPFSRGWEIKIQGEGPCVIGQSFKALDI